MGEREGERERKREGEREGDEEEERERDDFLKFYCYFFHNFISWLKLIYLRLLP